MTHSLDTTPVSEELDTNIAIDAPYELSDAQIAFYQENGFIKLKNVFSPQILTCYGQEFTRKVFELNTQHLPLEQRTTYQRAFLQVFNLWRQSDLIRQFVFGKRLGRIATELMDVEGVRIYHDQALYKESNGGFTPWHADQFYWPLTSAKCVTVWIPLQPTPLEMGPLAFGAKSQLLSEGRDLEIGDHSEKYIQKMLDDAGIVQHESAFDLGEVSFHSGWTFHRAGANTTERCREVMTIIYMDKNMLLKAPENASQQNDWATWCPGATPGEIIDTPLNPVIFSL